MDAFQQKDLELKVYGFTVVEDLLSGSKVPGSHHSHLQAPPRQRELLRMTDGPTGRHGADFYEP
jgi:hypothetical protein